MAEQATPGLVSVVIPVYNGARFLGEAIESVLAQDGASIEVIVVDDGSEDGSGEIARRFGPPVRCLRQANAGTGSARNAGVSASRGELLAFLDADDLWPPGRLRAQLDPLAARPELDCVFGLVEHFRDDESSRFENRADARAAGLLAGAMLIRRESFLKVGPFLTDRRLGEFIDWQLRAEERGLRSEVLPLVVLKRRIHDANMSAQRAADRGDYLRVVRAALERRRAARQT